MIQESTVATIRRRTLPQSLRRLRMEIPTLLVALTIYCGFFIVTWFFHDLPLVVTVPLGSFLLAWHSSLQHETIHGHPTGSRRINAVLGRPPLALWLPYDVYRETHLRHHRCKGQRLTRPTDDPESHYLHVGTLDNAGYTKRTIFWLNRTLIGRLAIGPALSIYKFWSLEIDKLRRREPARIGVWLRHGAAVAILLAWVVGVCRISLPIYVLAIVYPSISLGQLRSFGEHGSHPDPRLRTNVVETNWLLSLLYLNNNLHIAHHAKPHAPWYLLPAMWREMRHLAVTTGMTVRPGYRHVLRLIFFGRSLRLSIPARNEHPMSSPARAEDGLRIAALPMYDFPELRADTDALWARLAKSLTAAGISAVSPSLTRSLNHHEVWQHPDLLFAQACEYPIATDYAGAVRLVATPRYSAEGCDGALYRSAIVVRRQDPAEKLEDMRNRHCVINERSSNSGMNLLRSAVAPLAEGKNFFKDVAVSGSHRRSIAMVAEGKADIAAIDCVTLAHLRNHAPNHTDELRVLCWTAPSPSLPFVTAAGTDEATIRALRSALADVIDDPDLLRARERLFLVGFDFAPDESFARVLSLAHRASELCYPHVV